MFWTTRRRCLNSRPNITKKYSWRIYKAAIFEIFFNKWKRNRQIGFFNLFFIKGRMGMEKLMQKNSWTRIFNSIQQDYNCFWDHSQLVSLYRKICILILNWSIFLFSANIAHRYNYLNESREEKFSIEDVKSS